MSLGYRIIWVDDTPGWVDSVIDEVTEHVREAGYEPTFERLENGTELAKKCTDPNLDLIIMDYKLPGENGAQLISAIRSAGSFTEIVFYSQEWPPDKPGLLLDGVFRCERTDAKDKIKDVIDLTLHKLKDVGVIRGLVIASAIDLEVKVEELILQVFGDKASMFRERILEKQWGDFGKKLMFLQGIVKERISDCDSEETKTNLKKAKATLASFDKEVIGQRNILAHSRRTEVDGKVVLKGINKQTKQIEFNGMWLDDLREKLKKHQQNLDAIEKLLTETS